MMKKVKDLCTISPGSKHIFHMKEKHSINEICKHYYKMVCIDS